jgi:hypothetical protein
MAFGARQRFLDSASPAPDDDLPPGLAAALQFVADLLRDAKKADAFLAKAATAVKSIVAVRKAADDLEALQRKAAADLAAAKAQIDRERTGHEAAIAVAAKEIAAMKKQAADFQAQAEADAKSAAADKVEARKRLQAVERAVAGA